MAILPLAIVHTMGNLFTNMSLGKVAVSFTHTIKAMEPFFSVLLSALFLGEVSETLSKGLTRGTSKMPNFYFDIFFFIVLSWRSIVTYLPDLCLENCSFPQSGLYYHLCQLSEVLRWHLLLKLLSIGAWYKWIINTIHTMCIID